jgi:hypothetical protein
MEVKSHGCWPSLTPSSLPIYSLSLILKGIFLAREEESIVSEIAERRILSTIETSFPNLVPG